MRMARVTKLGLLLFTIAAVLRAGWTIWDQTRTWFFVKDLPITLSSGSHYRIRDIRTNMDALYSIEVNAGYSGPIDPDSHSDSARELACQIGVNGSATPCQAHSFVQIRLFVLRVACNIVMHCA